MGVFLGDTGCVQLKRTSIEEALTGTVKQSDVNTTKDRFSFDFEPGVLLTGDQVEIRTTNDTLLSFISADGWPTNKVYKDGVFYLFVDEVGAIRLYQKFDDAVSGEVQGRINLADPGRDVPISMQVRNNNARILGQVKSFEINTERDAVDISALRDEFRQQYSGLISGSGQITCFFEYERRDCDPLNDSSANSLEMPIYINQLILRTKLGSEFWARLTLVGRGPKPYGTGRDIDDEVWYEFDALVTQVGMAFSPTEPVEVNINFVTTGEIKLRTRFVSNYLLQEDLDRIKQEANQDGFIELEQQE